MWKDITKRMHEQINERAEKLYLSIFCESAFYLDSYIELRESKKNNLYVIYYSTMGTKQMAWYLVQMMYKQYDKLEKIEDVYDEFISKFDFWCFIREQFIKNEEFDKIQDIVTQNQRPSIKHETLELDGHTIVLKNYFQNETVFQYRSFPPEGYEYLQDVIDILADYLAKIDREVLKRHIR